MSAGPARSRHHRDFSLELSEPHPKPVEFELNSRQLELLQKRRVQGETTRTQSQESPSRMPFQTRSNLMGNRNRGRTKDDIVTPLEIDCNDDPLGNTATRGAPRSTAASTTLLPRPSDDKQDEQKTLLRSVLRKNGGSGRSNNSRSTFQPRSTNTPEQREYLRSVLKSSAASALKQERRIKSKPRSGTRNASSVYETKPVSSARSEISSAATTTQLVEDQSALLKKVLQRSVPRHGNGNDSAMDKNGNRKQRNLSSPRSSRQRQKAKSNEKVEKAIDSGPKDGTPTPSRRLVFGSGKKASHTLVPTIPESDDVETKLVEGEPPVKPTNTVAATTLSTRNMEAGGTLMERLMRRQQEREAEISATASTSSPTSTSSNPRMAPTPLVAVPRAPSKAPAAAPSRPSIVNVRAIAPEEGGYLAFLQTLQKEVSGDHTELWTSFRALFQKNAPLHVSEKCKRVKFDSKTKRMLVEMNLHLKRASAIECVTETQLVSDKKLTKEEIEAIPVARQSIADRVRRLSEATTKLPPPPRVATPKRKWTPPPKFLHESTGNERLETGLSVPRSDVTVHGADDEVSMARVIESDGSKAEEVNCEPISSRAGKGCRTQLISDNNTRAALVGSSNAKKPPSDKASSIPIPQEDIKEIAVEGIAGDLGHQSAALEVEGTASRYEQRRSWLRTHREKQGIQAGESVARSQSSSMAVSAVSNKVSFRKNSLLDAVPDEEPLNPDEQYTPRTLAGRKRCLEVTPDAGSCVAPWLTFKLRPTPLVQTSTMTYVEDDAAELSKGLSFSAIKPQKASEEGVSSPHPHSSASQNEEDSFIAPWSTLKLRSVHTPKQAATPGGSNADPEGLASLVNSTTETENPLEEVSSAYTSCQIGNTEASVKEEPSSPPLLYPDSTGQSMSNDVIDLNRMPSDTKVIELKTGPDSVSGDQLSVAIGQEAILLARTARGQRFAQIMWRIQRPDVKALTLDMAINRADISLVEGPSKSLAFSDVEGVLLFAGVFYQTSAACPSHPVGVAQEKATKLKAICEGEGQSSHVEEAKVESHSSEDRATSGLTDEEQKALETYRHMRRTKNPQEAIRDMVSMELDPVPLSEMEEEVAGTYRKMLKLMIPEDAVRHKMKKDAVADRIVDAVFPPSGSDPVEVSSVENEKGLSEEEERIAKDYRKMLKLRIPHDAVRHKMLKDQVDQRIIEAVLTSSMLIPSSVAEHSKSENVENSSVLTDEEEVIALWYRKMLKMMIPPDAVRDRMKRDQVEAKIVLAVLGPDSHQAVKASDDHPEVSLTAAEDEIASTYRKMLKLMIPPEAVRHKMKKDQVDPKITLVVLGADPGESDDPPKLSRSKLSAEEEAIAEQYRKMLKMKIPVDAIRHKMEKDGAAENVVEAVVGRKENPVPSKNTSTRGAQLVNIHWTVLSGEELNNSVWRAAKKQRTVAPQPEGSDISKLVELFQKKTNKQAAVAEASCSSGADKAKLLDLPRANNVAISLKAFKEFSHQELAETIANLDPLRKIRGERVQFIKDLLPTPTETKTIRGYKGNDSRLVPAELFFRHLVKVPRISAKVQVMQTMDGLKDSAADARQNLKVLAQVCHQVMTSIKLQEVLEMVLQVGNIMNEGTRAGGAAGFKFDSLLKLTQTKSADGKTTVLDYIVMIFVAKEREDALDLLSDFPECQSASRMAIGDMLGIVRAMSFSLDKCRTELEHIRNDAGIDSKEPPKNADAVATDPRMALMAAIQKRGAPEEDVQPKKRDFPHRAAFLAGIEAKTRKPDEIESKSTDSVTVGSAAVDEDDDEEDAFEDVKSDAATPDREDSIEGGIERLDEFVNDATGILEKLEQDRDVAVDACKALSRYCGESGGERATAPVLGILNEFATNLASAVKKYHARTEAEARTAAAQKKKEQQQVVKISTDTSSFPTTHTKESVIARKSVALESHSNQESTAAEDGHAMSTSISPNDKQSLVVLVNELLKDVPSEVKDDFKKGVVYDNPDDKLRAIYKKERVSLGFSSPVVVRPTQMDLMSAIKKRRERAAEAAAVEGGENEDNASDQGESTRQ